MCVCVWGGGGDVAGLQQSGWGMYIARYLAGVPTCRSFVQAAPCPSSTEQRSLELYYPQTLPRLSEDSTASPFSPVRSQENFRATVLGKKLVYQK